MKTILTISILFLLNQLAFADENGNDSNKIKYRITAVKNRERSIVSESNISEVSVPLSVYIPNAFSPNGDGLNDEFGVSALGVKDFSMTVYSKWGELIYESNNTEKKWDGTFGGDFVPDGSYAYYIHLVSADNKPYIKSGTVTVIK